MAKFNNRKLASENANIYQKARRLKTLPAAKSAPGNLIWDPATNSWWFKGEDGVLYELQAGASGNYPIDGGTY